MTLPLFSRLGLRDELNRRLAECLQQIEKVPLVDLRNPAFTGRIEKLWSENAIRVPMLYASHKSGKKREEESIIEDYGRQVKQKTMVVDVTIPYAGDMAAFNFSPSRRPIIQSPVGVRPDSLVCTIPMNPSEEAQLNATIAQIEQTLENMRSETASFYKHAIETITEAAARRKERLEKQEELATGFSFKVD